MESQIEMNKINFKLKTIDINFLILLSFVFYQSVARRFVFFDFISQSTYLNIFETDHYKK